MVRVLKLVVLFLLTFVVGCATMSVSDSTRRAVGICGCEIQCISNALLKWKKGFDSSVYHKLCKQ